MPYQSQQQHSHLQSKFHNISNSSNTMSIKNSHIFKNHKIIQNKIRIIIVIIVNLKINIIQLMKLKILINQYLGCMKHVEYDNNQITTIITIILINNIHINQIVVYYPHHKIPQTIIKQNIHNINKIYHHYHHNLLFYI